jgi:hypothetical protein
MLALSHHRDPVLPSLNLYGSVKPSYLYQSWLYSQITWNRVCSHCYDSSSSHLTPTTSLKINLLQKKQKQNKASDLDRFFG